MARSNKTVRDYIRTIPDFPHEGIMFRDVTTLFADPRGFRIAIDQLLHPYAGTDIDRIVGLEARGFILGGAIAHQLSVGFVPIRKKGKLPGKTLSQDYTLEYGEATMEIHDDAIQPGEKVLVVDDLLATGGTAEAGIKLLEKLGAAAEEARMRLGFAWADAMVRYDYATMADYGRVYPGPIEPDEAAQKRIDEITAELEKLQLEMEDEGLVVLDKNANVVSKGENFDPTLINQRGD